MAEAACMHAFLQASAPADDAAERERKRERDRDQALRQALEAEVARHKGEGEIAGCVWGKRGETERASEAQAGMIAHVDGMAR